MANLKKKFNLLQKDFTRSQHYESIDVEVTPFSSLQFNESGNATSVSEFGYTDVFHLLPAAAVAAGTDKMFTVTGTGTEVITQAVKGGVNLQSQATVPADGDNIFLAAVATTAFHQPIRANAELTLEMKVAINTITAVFASFGWNENVTDVDPTGTAGEGAMFLFDPTEEVTTGLTTAQHANFILAHKVNGVDTFTATSVPVLAGQDYDLKIVIDEDLLANYYINGVSVGQSPALTAADTIKVFLGAELTATPGGQKDFDARLVRVSRLTL